ELRFCSLALPLGGKPINECLHVHLILRFVVVSIRPHDKFGRVWLRAAFDGLAHAASFAGAAMVSRFELMAVSRTVLPVLSKIWPRNAPSNVSTPVSIAMTWPFIQSRKMLHTLISACFMALASCAVLVPRVRAP